MNFNSEKFFAFAVLLLILLSIAVMVHYNENVTSNRFIKAIDITGAKGIKSFSSYNELRFFISKHLSYNVIPVYGTATLETPLRATASDQSSYYSKTNVQVEGIDELDIVKTDGKYIYVASNNTVYIIMAYPPEYSNILSKIVLDGKIIGIFLFNDKLSVIMSKDSNDNYEVSIKIYDIEDRNIPKLITDFSVNGFYFESRAIEDYIYLIAKVPAVNFHKTFLWGVPNPDIFESVKIPMIKINDAIINIPANQIFYLPESNETYYEYTIIAALNVNGYENPAIGAFLLGDAHTLYMALHNLYITSAKWKAPPVLSNMPIIRNFYENTLIYRFSVSGNNIKYKASGEVPGTILNQFSIDEYNGYLRVTTTRWDAEPKNDVYILDVNNMKIISNITDLAPGEWIYSARFIGDKGYLVTFKKTDPLFVIDLSSPIHPKVLGWLKIPGYSNYLHLYDETHVIGIGKDTVEDSYGNFAWYQGIKISLFDVSDPKNPKEIAKYIIGDRGSDSPILNDHKALLFDYKRKLLAIPVLVAVKDPNSPPYEYGKPIWQGAYVFNVSLEKGFVVIGKISHLNTTMNLTSNLFYEGKYFIKRILYIDDVLYTISDKMIKMNSIKDMSELNKIIF
ncbi:MAG: beta-propeller domain-containing protein [Thermoprotei archaeon]